MSHSEEKDPTPVALPRTTRSNRVFSPWDIFHIKSTFDLASKLKDALKEPKYEEGPGVDDDSHSGPPSPTDSPMASPPPSPRTAPSTIHPLPGSSSHKKPAQMDAERRKQRRKANRTLSRNWKREQAAASFTVDRMRKTIAERYVKPTLEQKCDFNLGKVEVSPRAYVGKTDTSFEERVYSLEELVGPSSWADFELLDWDGAKPIALVDKCKRVIGLLAGNPGDKDWDRMAQEAGDAIEYWSGHCTFPERKGQHTRGEFRTLACRVSYGGGQREPTNIKNGKRNQAILNHLSQLHPFKCISGVLATRAPKLHSYYANTMRSLYNHHPNLVRPFPGSVFAANTYNMGPSTVCYPHIDRANLTYGTCTITPSGRYNPQTGGHLILWDLDLVITFPPGSTILIPSGILSHSNTSILPHETRYSFTQYTAGGLFHWVENGFMTEEKRRASMNAEQLLEEEKRDENWWAEGVALFPVMDDLLNVLDNFVEDGVSAEGSDSVEDDNIVEDS